MSNHKAAAAPQTSTMPANPFLAAGDWTKPLMDVPAKLQEEAMSFAAQRLRAQAEFLEGLAACRSPADLMERQGQFLRSAMEAYSAEAGRSWKLMQGPGA
ncbi:MULTISPECIES: phasin family protein [Roseomonadaceae]|uniref:Phasin family protein n=1 Tax=Falsiroseomonas oleicola TaxID=2801474 RepID=A0ABS6H258_9PROT|nr:phasin family protein [Roseomonas oleicola]MBU8542745.1 phasin family protein [Roseomonas oleicola]